MIRIPGCGSVAGALLIFLVLFLANSARIVASHHTAGVAATPVPGAPITLDGQQASEVAVLVEFIRAYNAGKVGAALALFGKQGGWSDCDYRTGRAIIGQGRASLSTWLKERAADHDYLEVGNIAVGTVQENVLGVTFRRRLSATLRALGHPQGIVPVLGAKVIFDITAGGTAEPQIVRLANGPYGGPQAPCRVHP